MSPNQPQTMDPLLDLIYSTRSIAQTLEIVYKELQSQGEDNRRDHEQILSALQKLSTDLQMLPVSTADRMEKEIDKRIDGVLEEVRVKVNETRNKLWSYIQSRRDEEKFRASTPPQGAPVVIGLQPTERAEKAEKEEGLSLHIKKDTLSKIWVITKWSFAILAAGGGITAFIDALLKLLHS
jgi:ElaB/YqjD/DUF883 family membrane-anchored ribosome-binding protein